MPKDYLDRASHPGCLSGVAGYSGDPEAHHSESAFWQFQCSCKSRSDGSSWPPLVQFPEKSSQLFVKTSTMRARTYSRLLQFTFTPSYRAERNRWNAQVRELTESIFRATSVLRSQQAQTTNGVARSKINIRGFLQPAKIENRYDASAIVRR